ncbi:MAG TPA: hypothetical protein VGH19_08490 [Verrucomicrobiae bacterium]
MPFSITEEPGHFFVKLFGVLTARDLGDFGAAAWELEKAQATVLPRVTDLSEVENLTVDFSAVWQLAENRRSRTFPNSFKSAIVAPKDHLLGYARMFQTLNDHPQITIRIFRDMASAREWILEK